jgi:DNA-binding beta-propeller fold protein YncE
VKIGPGAGAFGQDLFVARPRLFNVRGRVLIGPDEGEIFRVNLSAAPPEATVFSRLLEMGPSGLAFDPTSNTLVASSFLGGQLLRVAASGAAPTVVANLSGIQGLAFGPCPTGTCLYAAQPSGGQILRMPAAGGAATPFVTNLVSPVDVAFGPGGAFGSSVYVTDAELGQVLRYDSATGKPIDPLPFVSGLRAPFGLAFRVNGSALFVTDYETGAVVQISPVP